jgi:hypothetical protein
MTAADEIRALIVPFCDAEGKPFDGFAYRVKHYRDCLAIVERHEAERDATMINVDKTANEVYGIILADSYRQTLLRKSAIKAMVEALSVFCDDEVMAGLDAGPDDKISGWAVFRLGQFRAARAALELAQKAGLVEVA